MPTQSIPEQSIRGFSSLTSTLKENVDAVKSKMGDLSTTPGEEGEFTQSVENVTSKLPSMTWLGLSVGSMVASAVLLGTRKKELANFVGLWAPCFMLIGIYNKLVKLEGTGASIHSPSKAVKGLH